MTGIPKATGLVLFDRANGQCERCGWQVAWLSTGGWEVLAPFSRQHRQARGAGGTRSSAHRITNLALMCGSATTGCHGDVENHERAQGEADGWVVRHGVLTPELVPVLHWQLGWTLLHQDGGYTPHPCLGGDPTCPCLDGDACHYTDLPGSPALPVRRRAS